MPQFSITGLDQIYITETARYGRVKLFNTATTLFSSFFNISLVSGLDSSVFLWAGKAARLLPRQASAVVNDRWA